MKRSNWRGTKAWMNRAAGTTVLAFAMSVSLAEEKYTNDFQKAKVGSVPEDLLVLDGNFAVQEEGANKFMELPGAPLDTYGFLFGPAAKENVAATARFFGTAKGRRYPTFALGLNGVGGYKLWVSPGKKQLELYKGDEVKLSEPLDWKPGQWTLLKLEVIKSGESEWEVRGKIWTEGASEPEAPIIRFKETETPLPGRAMISASPFSGTPVRIDDLKVSSVAPQ